LALFDDFLSGAHGSRVHPFEEIVMKRFSEAIKAACVALGFAMPVTPALADQGSIPPWQLPELTAEWWQWALSIPQPVDINTGEAIAPFNPLVDPSGAACMVGQRGPIWFLAGNFTGALAITRACSVPADKTVFFPVINAVSFSAPIGVCGSGPPGIETSEQLRADIKPIIDAAAQTLSVTIDGRPVKKTLVQRVQSQVFDLAVPEDNVFVYFGDTCPATILSPAVDDGFYASLPPLSPRNKPYKIQIQAQSGSSITIDVTYNLTVVPVTLIATPHGTW
jgi:hypothetical protein